MIRSSRDAASSASTPSDRQSDHPGWNWHRSRSASLAGPHDDQRRVDCHHDAPERQRLPTRIQHAQVRFSWTSVHSSTKTPHEQKRDPKSQVNAPPLHWARGNPNSTRHRLPGFGHLSPRRNFIRQGPMSHQNRSRSKPEPLIFASGHTSWRCDHGDSFQRSPRVPISSDQGHVFVDRDHNKPGLLLKNEIWRRTRQARLLVADGSPSSLFCPNFISPAIRRLEKKPAIVRFLVSYGIPSFSLTSRPCH